MKPLCVWSRSSEHCLDGLFAQTDRLRLLEVRDPERPPARVVFMRIGEGPGDPSRACFEALRIQRLYEAAGARIVNPIDLKIAIHGKDQQYGLLRGAGLPTPEWIPNPCDEAVELALEQGSITLPCVVRAVGMLNGRGIHLARDRRELWTALAWHRDRRDAHMVCSLVDAREPGTPYHVRWRAYVLFGHVDHWECGIDRNWIVNYAFGHDFDPAHFQAANARDQWPSDWSYYAEKAAARLGLEVCAVDLVPDWTKDGLPIIVEVNDTFGMAVPDDLFPKSVADWRRGLYARLADQLSSL